MTKRLSANPARRRSAKSFPWWSSAIAAGVLLAVATFILVTHVGGSAGSGSSSGGAPRERGLPVGAEAPSRPLQSTDGNSISLGQMRGSKVVVYFYEGGGWGACQKQLVELQEQLGPIQDGGGRVVAVTTDSLESSRSLASQLHLGYPILQDSDHMLGSAFDVFRLPMAGMDMGPVDSHSIWVVNANGRVAWKKLAPDTMHVSVTEVVDAVKAAWVADETVRVVLIVADDCHLCDRARQVLRAVSGDKSLLIRELNWHSQEGGSLVQRDGVPFPPALYVGDSLVGYGRISERALGRKLSKTGS